MKIESKQKGFTLIELMIVIAIIGILASIAIPQFASFRVKAFNAGAQADLKNGVTTMEAAYNADFTYPVAAAAAVSSATITLGDYSWTASDKVTIGHSVITSVSFKLCTKHDSGDNTYTQYESDSKSTATASAAGTPLSACAY